MVHAPPPPFFWCGLNLARKTRIKPWIPKWEGKKNLLLELQIIWFPNLVSSLQQNVGMWHLYWSETHQYCSCSSCILSLSRSHIHICRLIKPSGPSLIHLWCMCVKHGVGMQTWLSHSSKETDDVESTGGERVCVCRRSPHRSFIFNRLLN